MASDAPPPNSPAASAYRAPEGAEKELTWSSGRSKLRYRVRADWQVIREQGVPRAEIFSVSYLAQRRGSAERPITFLFNGGPGAGSVYLHVGAAGPLRVPFAADGSALPPPVKLEPNQESWLPFTDLVFIDPVGTGFSRTVTESRTEQAPFDGDKDKQEQRLRDIPEARRAFYRVKRDLEVLSDFIAAFLSREGRWASPVYVAGESYGGFRVGKLIRMLPERGIPLKGASLISPVLDFNGIEGNDYDLQPWLGRIPPMALIAQYHGQARGALAKKPRSEYQSKVEEFVELQVSRLLLSPARLSNSERQEITRRLADYVGLDEQLVEQAHGRVSIFRFARSLLRERGLMCGLYDGSLTGVDPFPDREGWPSPDPSLGSSMSVFGAGINNILRTVIGLKTEREYQLLNMETNMQWTDDRHRGYWDRYLEALEDLRYGLALNPGLNVLVTHGLFDLVTSYFASAQSLAMLRLPETMAGRIKQRNYLGGHMYYMRAESRRASALDMREFVGD